MQQRVLLIIGILNLLAIICISITLLILQQERVVYVDTTKLLHNYKGMQTARMSFQNKTATWKANIDTLASEVQKLIAKYERESKSMTVKERSLSQELIRSKQKQFADYREAIDVQVQQEDTKMTNEVLSQVNVYLKKYGEEKGYQVILAATEYGNLAYADEDLDVTDEVLEGLNKEFIGK